MKKEEGGWKKELARDFLSLGSWIFFILVIVRVAILPTKWPYFNHLLIAGSLVLIVELLFRGKVEGYVSRGILIAFYTSLFYENFMYGAFVEIALAGLIVSSRYVGNSWSRIGWGVLVGILGVGLSFVF